jgi:hypothetical protein
MDAAISPAHDYVLAGAAPIKAPVCFDKIF